MLFYLRYILPILLALVVALPTAHAQPNPDLVVTVRDATGAGVANVVIDVRDADEGTSVARVLTDATGTARFPAVPVSAVRVAVQGTIQGGIVLKQPGEDAAGIAFYLGARSNRLDLRVEADGSVLPDPQTMLAPDVGLDDGATPATVTQSSATTAIAASLVPTASVFPTASQATVAPPTVAPVFPVDSNDTPIADVPVPFGWLIVVVLGGGLIAVLVLFVLPRRGA